MRLLAALLTRDLLYFFYGACGRETGSLGTQRFMEIKTEQLSTNRRLGYPREHKDDGEDMREIKTFSQFIVQIDLELWRKIH